MLDEGKQQRVGWLAWQRGPPLWARQHKKDNPHLNLNAPHAFQAVRAFAPEQPCCFANASHSQHMQITGLWMTSLQTHALEISHLFPFLHYLCLLLFVSQVAVAEAALASEMYWASKALSTTEVPRRIFNVSKALTVCALSATSAGTRNVKESPPIGLSATTEAMGTHKQYCLSNVPR